MEPEAGEYVTHVGIEVRPHVRRRRAGADGEPKNTGAALCLFVCHARVDPPSKVEVMGRLAPTPFDRFGEEFSLRPRLKPRKLWAPDPAGRRVDQHERGSPLRIRGSEEHAQRARVTQTEDDRSLGPGRIHHGADVVHAHLERGCAGEAIGHPRPALIQRDQAAA